jgi:hypothetical protein
MYSILCLMLLMLTMTITDAYIKLSAASHSSVRANTLLISGKRNNPDQNSLQNPRAFDGPPCTQDMFCFALFCFTLHRNLLNK